MSDASIYSSVLATALADALRAQRERERCIGYTRDSAYAATIAEALEALKTGGTLLIKQGE